MTQPILPYPGIVRKERRIAGRELNALSSISEFALIRIKCILIWLAERKLGMQENKKTLLINTCFLF